MTDPKHKSVDPWLDGGVTVGALREALSIHADDSVVVFGPDAHGNALRFYRVKKRDDNLIQIELTP